MIFGGAASILGAFLSYKRWHSVLVSVGCATLAIVTVLLGIFFFNCLRWRDLEDPPRQLKWKQRQRLAASLRSSRPGVVKLYLYHGVKDAGSFADDIRKAFESAKWKVYTIDDDLEGEPEHEHGLWVYGHRHDNDETAIKRDLIATAFEDAGVPISVDARVNISANPHPSVVIGRNSKNKDV